MKKIPWKILSLVVLLLAIVGVIIGFSVDWSYPSWIFISGSSTMQPLLQNVSKVYTRSEITADAGGSAVGIQDVLQNNKNMGAASKTPDLSMVGVPAYDGQKAINGSDSTQWQKDKIKTVTVAWDGIGIVYKKSGILKNKQLILTPKTIQWLYLAFSGYEQINAHNLIPNSWTVDYNPANEIVPFARSGGSMQSGTAESFVTDSRLLKNNQGILSSKHTLEHIGSRWNAPYAQNGQVESKTIQKTVWNVLENGTYGPYTHTTSESNLQTWQAVKSFDSAGIPITYLSAGFIKNNYQDIVDSGFGIAAYSPNDNGSDAVQLITHKDGKTSNATVSNGYNWFRPLNLIFKDNNQPQVDHFIEWMLANSLFPESQYHKVLDAEGFLPLTLSQMATMFNGNSQVLNKIQTYAEEHPKANYSDYLKVNPKPDWSGLWNHTSDYDLMQTANYNLRKYQNIWCGAIPQEK